MESLNISNREKLDKMLDKSLDDACKQEEFTNLVSRLKVDRNTLKKNVSKLSDTVEELKICKQCKGLYECKNKVEGHVFFPETYENRIKFSYTPCKYQKKFVKDSEEKITSKNILEKARMKDIDVSDKNRVKTIKLIKNFYDNYNPNKTQKALYLHGPFGSGKSFLVAALFNELAEKKQATSTIVYFPEFLRSLKEDFSLVESKTYKLKMVDLLLIDDLGAENVTEWGRDEVLGTILQHRMNEGKTTFITSNLSMKELENHLASSKNKEDVVKAQRIMERVKYLTEEIELRGINRRNDIKS